MKKGGEGGLKTYIKHYMYTKQTNVAFMYKYVLKHPFRQDIFKQLIEMLCLEIIS